MLVPDQAQGEIGCGGAHTGCAVGDHLFFGRDARGGIYRQQFQTALPNARSVRLGIHREFDIDCSRNVARGVFRWRSRIDQHDTRIVEGVLHLVNGRDRGFVRLTSVRRDRGFSSRSTGCYVASSFRPTLETTVQDALVRVLKLVQYPPESRGIERSSVVDHDCVSWRETELGQRQFDI